MRAAPITGIHLWFDRPVCPFDHVVTPGRLIQWVFNHTAIQGRTDVKTEDRGPKTEAAPRRPTANRPLGEGQYLQLVISASYDLLALDKVAIRDAVLADLAAIWPAARAAQLLRWWVVTEHGATFAVRPGVESIGLLSARRSTAFSWRVTGPIPAGRPRWKELFGADTWPPRGFSACWIGRLG